MKILCCDDEILFRQELKTQINVWSEKNHISEITVTEASSAEQVDTKILHMIDSDIFFLDIELGGMNGYELAEKIRQAGSDAVIVFISNHDTYLREGYQVGAYRYLKKPVSASDLNNCLEYCYQRIKIKSSNMTIKENGRTRIIPFSDILFFSYSSHRISINTNTSIIELSVQNSFSDFLTEHICHCFIRCHQAYAVNTAYISWYTKDCIMLTNNMSVPIGRSYQKEVPGLLKKALLG